MCSCPAWWKMVCFALGVGVAFFWGVASVHADPPSVPPSNTHTFSAGERIFAEKCASCHGPAGQGLPTASTQPLMGNLTVDELALLIDRTMPDGAPEQCSAEESQQVAGYLFEAFYSPAARYRQGLDPWPRRALARLTVAQYQNCIADIVGSFPRPREGAAEATPEPSPPAASGRGLAAQYFESQGMNKADQLKHERIDSVLDFDFGTASPIEGIDAQQFAVIWDGGLIASATGYYEFRITTPNGVRFYLNHDPPEDRKGLRDDSAVAGQSALVDAWVSSGQTEEHLARLFLLGGRVYPLRLEFFKYMEASASLRVEWKRPSGVWEVLTGRHLTTDRPARTVSVATPFPPDDRSMGMERGTSISREWHAATTEAAVLVVDEVMDRLALLAHWNPQSTSTAEQQTLLRTFAQQFARATFRRPMTEGEERELFAAWDAATVEGTTLSQAEPQLRQVLLRLLMSPQFLYVDLPVEPDAPVAVHQHAIAARLALTLWDSIPDATLSQVADQQQLDSAQIALQAQRMLHDPRARHKLQSFLHEWLQIGEREISKDATLFPNFDAQLIADLRDSLDYFLMQVVWSDRSDYHDFLRASDLWLNERLVRYYGATGPGWSAAEPGDATELQVTGGYTGPDAFRRYQAPEDQRSGLLTHPYLLCQWSYHDNSSPIHRGVFLTRNIVGRALRPPPAAVAFKNDEFDPRLTMREKITQLTSDDSCRSCHAVINPLGFALENFDAVGRWRTEEQQRPVDSQATYRTELGEEVHFRRPRDIAEFAARSRSAQRAFVQRLFQYLVKQDPAAYGLQTVDQLLEHFAAENFQIQRLVEQIAITAAQPPRDPSLPAPLVPSDRPVKE